MKFAYLLVSALCIGCGTPGAPGTGRDEPDEDLSVCGSTATRFSVRVQLLVAPYNFEADAWDWDGDIDSWAEDVDAWLDLLVPLVTEGALTGEQFAELLQEADGLSESIFSAYVAPDPHVEVYFSAGPSEDWTFEGDFGNLPDDTFQIEDLEIAEVDLTGGAAFALDVFDEDLSFNDPIGSFFIDLETAQVLGDCGPVSIVLSPDEMDALETRLNAFEVTLVGLN